MQGRDVRRSENKIAHTVISPSVCLSVCIYLQLMHLHSATLAHQHMEADRRALPLSLQKAMRERSKDEQPTPSVDRINVCYSIGNNPLT